MLSRVAENLYWIARYVERAEGLARLLEDAFSMELETATLADGVGPLENVLLMLSAREVYRKANPLSDGELSPADVRDSIMRFLTFKRGGAVSKRGGVISIRETIANARENARGTQEAISGEAWSQLNKLHLYLNSTRAADRFEASPGRFLDRIRRECVLFAALVDGTLPRTEAYHFLQVGRYLERVDMLSRVLNVHCYATAAFVTAGGEDAEVTFSAPHWASLLRGTSAYEGYLKQARERVDPIGVVRYLLLEGEFPRSMRFGVARCLESLRCIAGGSGTDAERHLGKLDSELRYMDIDDLFRRGVDHFLLTVQEACAAVSRDVHDAYFSA